MESAACAGWFGGCATLGQISIRVAHRRACVIGLWTDSITAYQDLAGRRVTIRQELGPLAQCDSRAKISEESGPILSIKTAFE
jgi:hypothetical protein